MSDETKRHDWERLYPRGSWPVYRCCECGLQCCPTAEELASEKPPTWFDSPCSGPQMVTRDDIDWLLGAGRYAQ